MSITVSTNHFLNRTQSQSKPQSQNTLIVNYTDPYPDSSPSSQSTSSTSSTLSTQSQKSYYSPKKRRIELYADSDTDIDSDQGNEDDQFRDKKFGSLEFPIDLTEEETETTSQHESPGSNKRRKEFGKRRISLPSLSPSPSLSLDDFDNSDYSDPQKYNQDNQHHPTNTDSNVDYQFRGDHEVDYLSQSQDILVEEENYEEEDILLIDDYSLDPIKHHEEPLMLTHSSDPSARHELFMHQVKLREKTPEDDDAQEFARLMQRYEGKRRYEILAEGAKEDQGQVQGHGTISNTSQTSIISSKSQREVEDVIGDDDEGTNKTLSFLGSIVTSFLIQLHTSQLILESQKSLRSTKRSPRKKQKTIESQPEIESQDQELLIYDEDEDDQGDDEEGSQDAVQTEVGVNIILKNRKTGNDQVISFPDDPLSTSGGQNSIDKITCILRIVAVLYEAVCSKTVVTLRDIFYRDKALFRKQDVVDKLVDDLVATAGLKRRDFFVCASAKGLIAAKSLKIVRRSGEEVILSSTVATLIDPIERIARLESVDQVDWVLVVEKDAVFQTLCSAKLLEDDRLGAGVMITGKGFPDLATRQLLHLISETYPNAKIYALVDADPHGLSILSTYTYGSQNTRYSHDHTELPLGDRIEWLGLRATDFKKLGIGHDDLLPLEKADIQMAMKMIKNLTLPLEWKRELSHMLHINRKAEIEIILEGKSEFDGDHDLLDDLFDDEAHLMRNNGSGKGDRRKSKLVEYIIERILN